VIPSADNPIYILYLPDGIALSYGGVRDANCSRSSAYHSWHQGGNQAPPVADWDLFAFVRATSSNFSFHQDISGGTRAAAGANSYVSINNGRSAALNVGVGSDAPLGSWVVFGLGSFRRDPLGNLPTDGDLDHFTPVGVYVN
jgi:hypothetical protein